LDIDVRLITSEYPPVVGGIASHVAELARVLAPQVRSVGVVHPGGEGPAAAVEPSGVVVRRPPLIKAQPFYTALLHGWLRREARAVDILHVHGVRPLAATAGLSAPTVFTNHSSGFLHRLNAHESRRRRTARLMAHVSQLIAPSDELVEAARALGYAGPARMIPNGVDVERFAPGGSPARAAWGAAADEVVVLLARRLAPKNGVVDFARALTHLKALSFRVVIAGDGVEREAMTAILGEAGMLERVLFLGSVANTEMPALYRAADLSVLPSLMEATSVAGLEAMACGLPLVGTRVGGIPAIIEDGATGLLAPPADPAALAQAMARLIADGALRRRMGAAARAKVEAEFSWPIIAQRTLAVYKACLDDKKSHV
jgi:glycosyltransferase involved in cell wall biosynthesis